MLTSGFLLALAGAVITALITIYIYGSFIPERKNLAATSTAKGIVTELRELLKYVDRYAITPTRFRFQKMKLNLFLTTYCKTIHVEYSSDIVLYNVSSPDMKFYILEVIFIS